MAMTRRQIEAYYTKAVLYLDTQWAYLVREFGEDIARKIFQTKTDAIEALYSQRLRDNHLL